MQLTQTNRRNNRHDFLGHITKPQALSETGAFLFSESQAIGGISKLEGASWSHKAALKRGYEASKKISSKWKSTLEL